MNREKLISEILLAVEYKPHNLINTVYMGSIATVHLYRIIGANYPEHDHLVTKLKTCSEEKLLEAHKYTQSYRDYIPQQKAGELAWARKIIKESKS